VDEARPKRRPALRSLREAAETILMAAAIYLGVQLLVPPYAVDGASMAPNLSDGERLLVNRSVYAHFDANRLLNLLPGVDRDGKSVVYPFHAPERGEIVVFHPPGVDGRPYIKRVIGVPGDEVAFAEGTVLVNGRPLPESYIDGQVTFCPGGDTCRLSVPDGTVYVLGDNRRNSTDSRVFGPVPYDAIVGKAWLANWPLDDIGFIPDAEYDE
jgi:signal peptidase I